MADRDEAEVVRLLQDEVLDENDATSEEEDAEVSIQAASDTESSCIKDSGSEFVPEDEDSETTDVDSERARSSRRRSISESQGRPRGRPRLRARVTRTRERPSSRYVSRSKYTWNSEAPARVSDRHSAELSMHLPHSVGEAKNARTPLESWSLLFPNTLLEKIVLYTNEEIQRKRGVLAAQRYHRDTSLEELKALLGLFYLTGIYKLSKCNPEDMWSEKAGMIQFRGTMSLNRFKFLISCLRFDHQPSREQRRRGDRFAPIREVWDEFIENCKKYYSPSQSCTIDEQLLGFRGRCAFRIYMKNKPDKYGLKIVMLNDAKTGYMLNAIPYAGLVENDRSESIPDYYVRKLSEPIYGSGRNVTTDNWFTSVPIVDKMLKEYSLAMIGAIRKNKREIPEYFKTSRAPGTADFAYDNNKMLVSYVPKRNKIALILSSLNQSPTIDEETGKPVVVLDYNRTKGGTDMFDQFCHRFSTTRKTDRWPLRIFYGMLDQSGVNSCALYNLNCVNTKLPHRQFLIQLSAALIEPHLRQRLTNLTLQRSLRSCIISMLGIEGPPSEKSSEKLSKRVRCHFCESNLDRKTSTACVICQVPICPEHRRPVCVRCADE